MNNINEEMGFDRIVNVYKKNIFGIPFIYFKCKSGKIYYCSKGELLDNKDLQNKIIYDFEFQVSNLESEFNNIVFILREEEFYNPKTLYNISTVELANTSIETFDGQSDVLEYDKYITVDVARNDELGIIDAYNRVIKNKLNNTNKVKEINESSFSELYKDTGLVLKEGFNINDINVFTYVDKHYGMNDKAFIDAIKEHNKEVDNIKKIQLKLKNY